MKSLLSISFMLACICPADAQIASVLQRLDDGRTEIKIKNNSAVPVAAFAISAKLIPTDGDAKGKAAGTFLAYYDPAIDSSTELAPDQERVLPPVGIMCGQVMKQTHSARDIERFRTDKQYRKSLICDLEQPVIAAVFGDGSTTGAADLLTRLLLRRSNMLLAIDTTIETLSRAGRHNVPRDQLISDFTNLADGLNRWYLSDEQQIGRRLYQSIAAKLMNLPHGELGSAFPPSDFVRQETALLNEQRIALVQSQPNLELMRAGIPRP